MLGITKTNNLLLLLVANMEEVGLVSVIARLTYSIVANQCDQATFILRSETFWLDLYACLKWDNH